MSNKNRQHLIHLHGSTEPTLQILLDNDVKPGEIVVYHGKDEQALYIIYDNQITDNNDTK